MQSRLLSSLALFAGFSVLSTASFAWNSGHIELNLHAYVEARCELGTTTARATSTGTRITLAASCNAPNFRIDFGNAQGVSVTSAQLRDGSGRISTIENNSVSVTAYRPGGYAVDIEFSNAIGELQSADITITPL